MCRAKYPSRTTQFSFAIRSSKFRKFIWNLSLRICGTSTEAGEGFICVSDCGVEEIGWCVCVAGGGLDERFISYVLRRFHNLKREALGVIDLRWTVKKYPGWLPNFGAPFICYSAISYPSHIILVFAVLQTLLDQLLKPPTLAQIVQSRERGREPETFDF